MATSPIQEGVKLILPGISDVRMPTPRKKGKIKIPTFEEMPKVRGTFRNIEASGMAHMFSARFWKGAPKRFCLEDDKEYVIPRGVADHLNGNCDYKRLQWVSETGDVSTARPVSGIGRFSMPNWRKELKTSKHRFMFQINGDA